MVKIPREENNINTFLVFWIKTLTTKFSVLKHRTQREISILNQDDILSFCLFFQRTANYETLATCSTHYSCYIPTFCREKTYMYNEFKLKDNNLEK